MDLFVLWYATHVTRMRSGEALPGAPVRPGRAGPRGHAIRHGSARALHRLADRLDPPRVRACVPRDS
jgi:hypothetical protein